jgi:NAD(P)-dependent dehydrogenase (short-subunit alcohol dehydrogenase family)
VSFAEVKLPGLGPGCFVVITGGGGALGSELATTLSALGVTVGLIGRSAGALDEATMHCLGPGEVLAEVGDVTSRASLTSAITALQRDADLPLSGLVTMAAVSGSSQRSEETSEAEASALLGVNVGGTFETVRACVPALREAGGGSIVLVGSVVGHRARAGSPLYGAAKAAVLRLSRQLAYELGPDGIRVNTISPGQGTTRVAAWDAAAGAPPEDREDPRHPSRLPLRRGGEARDSVGPVLFLLSDLSGYVTGVDIPVDGGLLATL